MHPHTTPNGSLPSLPGWSRTAIALIAQAGQDPVDLYLRVSGGRQEKEQTIDTQHDVLSSGIELCGGRVGEVFKDDPFTGTVRDRIVGTLRCITGDLSECVAGRSTSKG